jgi:hypothetical protein
MCSTDERAPERVGAARRREQEPTVQRRACARLRARHGCALPHAESDQVAHRRIARHSLHVRLEREIYKELYASSVSCCLP